MQIMLRYGSHNEYAHQLFAHEKWQLFAFLFDAKNRCAELFNFALIQCVCMCVSVYSDMENRSITRRHEAFFVARFIVNKIKLFTSTIIVQFI